MRPPMLKYPRTQHLQGSRLQAGDQDLSQVPFKDIRGLPLVVEEKMDGANCGLSFDTDGQLLLQSRGHYLDGGPRERHFALLKQWAQAHASPLQTVLQSRYILYGEWMFAKHTCFYDALPHYFLEFDVYDREQDLFLSTTARARLLQGLPIVPVKVLLSGPTRHMKDILRCLGPCHFKTPGWRDNLRRIAQTEGCEPSQVMSQTDQDDSMEGLYIKIEDEKQVLLRLKYVRASFLNAIMDSDSHWLSRRIIPNQLQPQTDLWAPDPLYGGPS